MGQKFLGFCELLEFKTITPMSVKNSSFTGPLFEILKFAGVDLAALNRGKWENRSEGQKVEV